MAWRVARCLNVLLAQIDAAWPDRSRRSDGSIGDAAHSSRASDHNPDSGGVVRARDFTHDPANGFDAHAFADRLLRAQDGRLKYIISNGRIGSGPSGVSPGLWRRYYGTNAHTAHCHVSVISGASADYETPWAGVTSGQLGSRIPDLDDTPEDWLMALTDEQQAQLHNGVMHLVALFPTIQAVGSHVWKVPQGGALGAVTPDVWLRDARLAAGMAYTAASATPGDVDLDALATRIREGLGDDLAAALARRLES